MNFKDTPEGEFSYAGLAHSRIKLLSGSAEINGRPMIIGRNYNIGNGDILELTSQCEMEGPVFRKKEIKLR